MFCFAALGAGFTATAATVTQTLVVEPDQSLTPIYSFIQAAKSTIDMTMYELVDTEASGLLCTAASKGITVRVILDVNDEKSNNTAAYNQLNSCGVKVVWAWTTYEATHEKSIVIDAGTSNAQAAIMTLNLTSRYYRHDARFRGDRKRRERCRRDRNHLQLGVQACKVTPPDGDDLVWSPTNSQTSLLSVINNAKQTLLVENEEMSDSAIVSALESAAKNGVQVTVVMTNDDNDYPTNSPTLPRSA